MLRGKTEAETLAINGWSVSIKKARALADKILSAPKHEQPGMVFWAICLSSFKTSRELILMLRDLEQNASVGEQQCEE